MARSIVIPLYDHTGEDEIAEIIDMLRREGIDNAQVVHAYASDDDAKLADDAFALRDRLAAQRLASIDQDGRRTDSPVYDATRAEELREVREAHSVRVGVDRYEVRQPDSFRDHAEEIGYVRSLELLRLASVPINTRPGWRRTGDGREWYSSAWLDRVDV